jgi:hypothetical protein
LKSNRRIIRAVRRRATSAALAFYLFIWFGIIVPGHRRGVVSFDKGTSTSGGCCCCCCECQAIKTPAGSQTPPANSGHCAICDFAAHLTIPPPVDFSLPPMGLLERLPTPTVQDLVSLTLLTPFDGRGPPAV